MPPLTPDLLLRAYAVGVFPMAESATSHEVFWLAPDPRAILPLDGLRVSRSLRQTIRRRRFEVRVDTAMGAVLDACAAPAPGREQTWINAGIRDAIVALHAAGVAHTVECWSQEAAPRLVGGLYGVALGGAFFGESMFSRASDASKVALAHLVDRLRAGGFALLDVQMQTPHLERLGAVEVSRAAYERRLAAALELDADWGAWGPADS